MAALARTASTTAPASSCQPARILGISEDGSRLTVGYGRGGEARRRQVRWVASGTWCPAVGEEVLLLGAAEDEYYAAGPLATAGQRSQASLSLPAGGEARLNGENGALEVLDASGSLVFRYLDRSGHGCLRMEAAEVELTATEGDLSLMAAGEVRVGGARIRLDACQRLAATVHDVAGRVRSLLSLDRDATALSSGTLDIRAREVRGEAAKARWSGRSWQTRVAHLSVTADRMDTTVGTLVENARNSYRRVTDLCQLSARRARRIIGETLQVKARRVLFRASEAYKVRGDKIHLG